MKILYVDPISPIGHVNFNKIHIESLKKKGHIIDFIFKEGYSKLLDIPDDRIVLTLKAYSFKDGIRNRINILRNFIRIKKWLKYHEYDTIIFSSFDEMALYLSNIKPPLYLINHNNLAGVEQSYVKRFFYKHISKRNTQIVMDKSSVLFLSSIGVNNVYKVSHGLTKEFLDCNLPETYRNYKSIIFAPSVKMYGDEVNNKLINDKELNSYLKKHNVLLLLKSSLLVEDESNIKLIKRRLSNEEYKAIFANSDLIILSYSIGFKYRTSGILMECIANDKRVLLSDISALREYEDVVGNGSFWSNYEMLRTKIVEFVEETKISKEKISYNKDRFVPDYSFIKGKNGY